MVKDERSKRAEFAAWLGIIVNLGLALIKWIVGTIAHSSALIADAVHSASDVAGSLAVLIGLRAARKPPDEDHPYGHGKAESISAIIVSIFLFIVGIEVVNSSFRSLLAPLTPPGVVAIYVALLSMVVKEGLFRYKFRLGKELHSQALIANAWEHRSDVYSSFAAMMGIGGAILGGKLGIPILLYLDPVMGLVVSFLVLKMAYGLLKDSIHNTLDHVIHGQEAKELEDAVEMIPGVLKVNQLLAREHGYYLIVDVKIGVNPVITVEEGHSIGKQVKQKLMDEFEQVHDVLVHVNPYGPGFNREERDILH